MLVFVVFGLVALVVAWVIGTLASILSGDRREDTAGLWIEIFSRLFLVSELGEVVRVLNQLG